MFDIHRAVALAVEAHDGQYDKGRKHLPYIVHPMRVMCRFQDPELAMVAVLHDAIEDSHGRMTLERLRRAGAPPRVVEAVDVLTRRDGEPDAAYLARVGSNADALAVKLVDLGDNADAGRLGLLDDRVAERLEEKYRDARRVLYGDGIERALVPPPDLEAALLRFAGADVEADAVVWNPHGWSRLDGVSDLVGFLADHSRAADSRGRDRYLLSRRTVFGCRHRDPAELFVASMIFGFGTAAHGPGRTELVLAADDAGSTIRRAVEVLRRGGPAQAHRFLTTPPGRLRHCRASWASRFLYFAGFRSGIQRRQPLVLDARVAARLARYGIDLDVHAPDDYEVYLRLAASWCTHLGLGRADRVELALAAR